MSSDLPPCKCGGEAVKDLLVLRSVARVCVFCESCWSGVFAPGDGAEDLWRKIMAPETHREEPDLDEAIDAAMSLGDYEKAHRLLARKRARK